MITAISTNAAVVGGRPYSDGQRRVALNANPEPIETERDRLKATAIDRGVVWCGAAESLSNGASPSCPNSPTSRSASCSMHSILSASGASRRWNCPGSIGATRGAPRIDSAYSAEGTAAHELAQLCLTTGRDADRLIGTTIGDTTVTPAMATDVQVYIDVCRRIIDASDIRYVEHPS